MEVEERSKAFLKFVVRVYSLISFFTEFTLWLVALKILSARIPCKYY